MLCAVAAEAFAAGTHRQVGAPLEVDEDEGVLREGYIVVPRPPRPADDGELAAGAGGELRAGRGGARRLVAAEHALDDGELEAFLEERLYCVLATASPRGRAQARPVGFTVFGGAFWFATVAGGRLRNVERTAWASVVVAEGEGPSIAPSPPTGRSRSTSSRRRGCPRSGRSGSAPSRTGPSRGSSSGPSGSSRTPASRSATSRRSSSAGPRRKELAMGFLDKAKAMAEQATTMAKEGVEDVQTKRELGQTFGELGKTTFELVESGEISHPRLEELAAKIRELKAKAEDEAATPPATRARRHRPRRARSSRRPRRRGARGV